MNKRVVIVLAIVLGVIGLFVLVLATGGTDRVTIQGSDPAGDVDIDRGPDPPRHLELSDIRNIRVSRDEESAIFFARMGAAIARRSPGEAGTWRWEIYEAGAMTWIVTANVDVGPNASIISTQTDYSATTVDDSFPGKVSVVGDTLTIRLDARGFDGFPIDFDVLLRTSLDASRSKASSALAGDRAPNSGNLTLGT